MATIRATLRLTLLLAATASSPFASGSALGTQLQEPPFVLEVDASILSEPAGLGGTLGQNVAELTVFANGHACSTLNVAQVTSANPTILLGLPGQPKACSSQDAVIVILDSRNRQMTQQFTLNLGGRAVLDNLAPVPPGTGYFQLTLPASALNAPVSQEATDARSIRELLGSLTVLAEGQECLTADLSLTDSYVLLLLGPGQPPICSQHGAALSFRDGLGRLLAEEGVLLIGEGMTLSNLAPSPVADPATEPPSEPEASSPAAITPPDTGDAGLLVRKMRQATRLGDEGER